MTPAGLRDFPQLAWLLTKRSSTSSLGAVCMLPLTTLVVYCYLPFLHHRDRQTMVALTGPPGRAVHSWPALVLQVSLTIAALTAISVIAECLPQLLVAVLAITLTAWVLIGFAVTIKTLSSRRRSSLTSSDWRIGLLAANPGHFAIIDVARLADPLILRGEKVAAVARTAKHARIYGRYGFVPTSPGALTLTYTKP